MRIIGGTHRGTNLADVGKGDAAAHLRPTSDRVREAIFSDDGTVDPRTTVLVALAHHAGLLRANLDRKRLKTRKKRIDSIIKGDAVGRATKQAIEAVQAAVMVAAVMPAVIASTTSH